MRGAVAVCAVLWSCAPAEAPEHGVQRQALPGAPTVPEIVGVPGALMGSSLAACASSGFVAGAPGAGTAWLSVTLTTLPSAGTSFGRAVACDELAFVPYMLIGGPTGLRKQLAGGWFAGGTTFSVLSLSRSDDVTLPMLAGEASGLQFINLATTQPIGTGPVGNASVVQWFPGMSRRFAVANTSTPKVTLYDFNPGTNVATQVLIIPNPGLTGFGRSLAVGDFLPEPGLELAVGASGAVLVYSADGVLRERLGEGDLTFGSALAVEHGWVQGLDALWVGVPGLDQVYRFIGDAGAITETGPAPGSDFGASLAFDPMNTLAIGAPRFSSNAGAVYFDAISSSGMTGGEVRECAAAQTCVTTNCKAGVCRGGVFCVTGFNPPSACLPDDTCVGGECIQDDGGVRDAGGIIDPNTDGGAISVDAGTPIDSGVTVLDGGSVDAGPTIDGGPAIDAGPMSDAGAATDGGGETPRDAGTTDGGKSDAGSRSDAGEEVVVDAGSAEDIVTYATSCGCSGGAALPMMLLALGLFRRRRST